MTTPRARVCRPKLRSSCVPVRPTLARRNNDLASLAASLAGDAGVRIHGGIARLPGRGDWAELDHTRSYGVLNVRRIPCTFVRGTCTFVRGMAGTEM